MALPAVLFMTLFGREFADLSAAWFAEGDNSYCFLVPFVTAYLLWTRKDLFQSQERQPSQAGTLLLAGSLVFYVLGLWGGLEVIKRIALVASINALALAYFGSKIYRAAAFPLLFLFFMIPVPITITGPLTLPLQMFATTATRVLLSALSLPVEQAGNILMLPSGKLEVAEACSGLRSSVSLITLGVLLSYLWLASPVRRGLLVLLAIPAALAANILRISITVVGVHYFGRSAANGFFHELLGFLTFFFGLGFFMLGAKILTKRERNEIRRQDI